MNVYSAQKFVIRMIVVLLAVIAVLMVVDSAYALSDTSHPTYTGGSECHAYNTNVAVIQPVYDYCQNAHAIGQDTPKKRSTSRTVTNKHTTDKTVETVQNPPVIDNGGATVPDDNSGDQPKDKSNHGNHYGNDKGDFNCKDTANKHNTCKPNNQDAGMIVFLVSLGGVMYKRFENVRIVSTDKHTFQTTITYMDDTQEIVEASVISFCAIKDDDNK